MADYKPIIGIEVHIELKTESKMFCGCSAKHFRVKPNTGTCPVCLGLPGALPVPNKKAIDWCVMIGLALNCKTTHESKFDRKNYFYPDLPKGYQISQYDKPFCINGKLKINEKSIRINRVHMEEDTGKLIHKTIKGKKYSLIDFNRSGVPLVEIVTEPDIRSSKEAVLYLKKLQQIIRFLDVSDCDMEKGSMRCEVNISQQSAVSSQQSELPSYKVEVKNINSFKFVKRAIDYEIQRQQQILEQGKTPIQETRGYNEKTGKTVSQRSKEEAHDYRYFPEPDIPPIKFKIKEIEKLRNLLPEFPDVKVARFIKEFYISSYNAQILCSDKSLADYFDKLAKLAKKEQLNHLANIIVNKKINTSKIKPKNLLKKLASQECEIIEDTAKLTRIISLVIKNNKKPVEEYKKGKIEVLGFLIGQVMRETKGKADAKMTKKILYQKLANLH